MDLKVRVLASSMPSGSKSPPTSVSCWMPSNSYCEFKPRLPSGQPPASSITSPHSSADTLNTVPPLALLTDRDPRVGCWSIHSGPCSRRKYWISTRSSMCSPLVWSTQYGFPISAVTLGGPTICPNPTTPRWPSLPTPLQIMRRSPGARSRPRVTQKSWLRDWIASSTL